MTKDVVVLDYGSGNVRSAVRALERVGASVTLTADPEAALASDGLFVPGGRPVLGVCVGMQVLFDGSTEPSATPLEGLGEWPGTVERLPADVVPHMGWSEVEAARGSELFRGVEHERFYFVHSYAVQEWTMETPTGSFAAVAPKVTWATHGSDFVAAVENGPLAATQFHPEKSGEAGLALLENWVRSL